MKNLQSPENLNHVSERHADDRVHALDRESLLQVSKMFFPEILSINLTRETYRFIQYYDVTTLSMPREGSLNQMLAICLPSVASEDQKAFRDTFFIEGLREAVAQGKDVLRLTYRRRGQDGVWHWVEATAMRQSDPDNGDILFMVVSRGVDQEKAGEETLRKALESTSEQLKDWLYYDGISSRLFPGLVYVDYEDGKSSPYVVGRFALRMGCDPRELALCRGDRVHPDDRDALLLAQAKAKREGVKDFHTEYRFADSKGEYAWVSSRVISFVDRDGDAGWFYFLNDVTHERALMEKLRLYMETKLRENEQVFNIVAQHSDRILYAYDLKTGTTRPWDVENQKKDILAHLYEGNYSGEALDINRFVLPDSLSDVKQFFTDIHTGKPSGEAHVHVVLLDGQRRWYHFKYSSLFENGQPTTALISIEDVTERHEQEIAYLRFLQSMEERVQRQLSYMEADLTADRIEKHTGLTLWNTVSAVGKPYSEFAGAYKMGVDEKADAAVHEVYARETLLRQYEQGARHLEHIWQVERPERKLWLQTETVLMMDPFTGHVKLFVTLTDVTDAQEKQRAVQQRADYDAMTGLLRRDVGEERIRQHLAEGGQNGGILVALDLDDLKGINDTLGHKHGDKAIRGIADTLKSHFRKDDVLIRAGGDEFIAFLPGAGKSVSSVELSMASLLRKLSGIPIGEDDERCIHCSAGCAVEVPGTDTFESLYQRADLALYHVKRNGKNNFSFFEPEMLQADYEFKVMQAAPVMDEGLGDNELTYLLKTAAAYFPGIVLFNLTRNQFRVLSAGENMKEIPPSGAIAGFWENLREFIHPDDQEDTVSALSRDGLLSIYTQGQRSLRHYYRSLEEIGCVRTEIILHLYTTDAGDICAFLFFRWDAATEQEREIQRLQKILELSDSSFEYICLIDVRKGTYSTFSRDGQNTHEIPEFADFNMATRHIRDTQLRPEDREAYYNASALEQVLAHMNGPDGRYVYRYTLEDGAREASFTWYEKSHSELLMTVRRVEDT